MEFELKTYKIFKIKYYLKKKKLFFFCTTNLQIKNLLIEQTSKQLNLSYFRLSNKLAIRTIEFSIYKNFKQLIHSFTILVSFQLLKLKTLTNLENVLILLSIKLNNKIYSILQLKNLIFLDYNFNILKFYRFFIIYFEFAFKIIQKNFEIM